MSGRWSVYWDAEDGAWRAEPNAWHGVDSECLCDGFGSWADAYGYADRMARLP